MKTLQLIGLFMLLMIGMMTVSVGQTRDITLKDAQMNTDQGSITTSMRCPGGGVAVGGDFTASRTDVTLVDEAGVDCTGAACSAWQMTFLSESPEPFYVKVNAQCKVVDSEKIESKRRKEALLNDYPALRSK